MFAWLVRIFLLLLFPAITWGKSIAYELPVIVSKDVAKDFLLFVGDRDIHSITNYGGAYSRRDVAELLLFHQALRFGGYQGEIVLRPRVSIQRALRELAQGVDAAWGMPMSEIYFDENTPIYYSDPVTVDGEFEVGLYTLPTNQKALEAKTLQDLRSLCFVSSRFWRVDWLTLQDMELPCLYNASRWPLMIKMVAAGHADVALAPFQNTESMALYESETKLIPIPGIKIALKGNRRWYFSRIHPAGKLAYEHVQKGLAVLRQRNLISKAYVESGFWHPKIKHWKQINPPLPRLKKANQHTAN